MKYKYRHKNNGIFIICFHRTLHAHMKRKNDLQKMNRIRPYYHKHLLPELVVNILNLTKNTHSPYFI